ncbi:MAG: hypothetical protein ABJM29_16960 [Rhizobiaceae bacterium]
MSVSKSAKKLKRLVLAQTVAESMAKSQVGELSASLRQQETKLEEARESFANATTSLVFADLHLRHIHGLANQCGETRNELEEARRELQSETVRNKKLKSRLKSTLVNNQRDEESKLMMERLDRFSATR